MRYLALAGEKSLALYALDEAEARFRQALDLIGTERNTLNPLVADVLLNIARIHYFRGDMKGIISLLDAYLPRTRG